MKGQNDTQVEDDDEVDKKPISAFPCSLHGLMPNEDGNREREGGTERERESFAVLYPTMKSGTSFNGIYSNRQQFLCALLYEIMINLIAEHAIALNVDVPPNCEKCPAAGRYCRSSRLPPPSYVDYS